MSKALVVVFFRYAPRVDDHYKTQSKLFFKYAKRLYPFIDHLYLADAGWNIPEEDLHPNTTKITTDYLSHCDYMNKLTSMVSEDVMLLVDPDMLMYDSEVIKQGFDRMEDYDISGILDNSGTTEFFPANDLRAVRKRFTPYLTFMRMDMLKTIPNIDYTWTQKNGQFEYDSMGKLTEEILSRNSSFYELPDDRTTLRLHEDFSITKDSNLDGPGYLWSEPLDQPKRLGYYHVRNSSVGLSLLVEYQYDFEAYRRRKEITPFAEAMRLIAWQWCYDKYTQQLDIWRSSYLPVLEDYKVPFEVWVNYVKQFEEYHSWIKDT